MAINAETLFPQIAGLGGAVNYTVGPVLASAATIAPTFAIHHVSGTATITTITVPWTGFTGPITLVPDAAWSLATGGNIASAYTAIANSPVLVEFDGVSWYVAGGAASGTITQLYPYNERNASWAGSVIGIGTLQLVPLVLQAPAAFRSVYLGISNSFSATNAGSSQGQTVSVTFGVWTRSASSLSLASSGSVSTAYTVTGSSSSNSYQGAKLLPVPATLNMTPGNYWYGYIYSSATAGNAIMGAASNIVMSYAGAESAALGVFGSASTASFQAVLGKGSFSATSAALPASIAFSDIITAGNTGQPLVAFVNYTV